jgi:hypothetical protein
MEKTPLINVDLEKAKNIRKTVLFSLYRFFTEAPYAEYELSQLAEICEADAADLNWNIVYLEKCGLVELGRSSDCPPYVSCTATITAAGVDLVETPGAVDEKFQ